MSDYEQVEHLNDLCRTYLEKVLREMKPDFALIDWEDEDWWSETFKFKATNNWDKDFDISTMTDENPNSYFSHPQDTFDTIHYINSYYENEYGKESIMDWNEICSVHLLRHYAYVYAEEHLDDFIAEMKEEWEEHKAEVKGTNLGEVDKSFSLGK